MIVESRNSSLGFSETLFRAFTWYEESVTVATGFGTISGWGLRMIRKKIRQNANCFLFGMAYCFKV
jgi:hypothetical protein